MVGELPNRGVPLDVGKAKAQGNASGQLSTRRRWGVGSLFSGQLSTRLTGGAVSHRGAAASSAGSTGVKGAIEVLQASTFKEPAEVVSSAKMLLSHCTDHKKILEVCKRLFPEGCVTGENKGYSRDYEAQWPPMRGRIRVRLFDAEGKAVRLLLGGGTYTFESTLLL